MKTTSRHKQNWKKMLGILPVFATFLTTSCGLVELEGSKNGNLDGYWHMETVDTLSNGGSLDLRKERRFWMVQGTIFQLYSPDILDGQRYVSHFQHEGGQLTINKIYFDKRESGDPAVEDVENLRPFGINNIDGETFQVDELTGSRMTLRSETLRLTFKKH
ncbi:MAG: lipocalin-like domain-containing protein [Prevotella sp.]|nr:lipocalin-like domain-containing protein [Prevotella sp.]